MSLTTAQTTAIPAGTWVVDPVHSAVHFSVRHAGIANVRGRFSEFEGILHVEADGAVHASGVVRAASVYTGAEYRDAHLRSADFFDVEEHPELRFETTAFELDGEDLTVRGSFTMHGVTRELELRGELLGVSLDDEDNTRAGLTLETAISRADYGMRFNQALGGGNMLVGDKVKISIEISAVRQPA